MRIIEGFTLRTVMGEAIVVGEGTSQVNFNKLISLNPSAALLWKAVEGRDFTNDDLADLLVSNYDIDRETALTDAAELSADWIANGLVEE